MESTATAAGPVGPAELNGPEGILDWNQVDWGKAEANVRSLRQRIFKASQRGDLKQVRNLQKLMLKSYSNTLVSVKRVTQHNAGRNTAGVDKQVVLTPTGRAALAHQIHYGAQPWKVRPVKRVYIPKANGKQRPLGIPVVTDRVLQARVKNALEPEWEAKFEPKNYGFRPGRSCQDAIAAIYNFSCKRDARSWVLEADLEGAFDNISHDHLMSQIGSFPARELVRQWLKAGVVDAGRFAPTESGAPQGGVISPLLLNVALHGLEHAAGVTYGRRPSQPEVLKDASPALVRYADDFVVLCTTKEQAQQVRRDLEVWLDLRGLKLSEEKTGIVRLSEGFDFLGFNIRTYNGKLLIKPSRKAMARIREKLSDEVVALRGANAGAVIKRLNPIIRGWAAYYRTVVSSDAFQSLDHYLAWLLWKWAKRQHPRKSPQWIRKRYWGKHHPSRNDNWVFGTGNNRPFVTKFSWVGIERHALVRFTSSPDDADLADYWERRGRTLVTKAPMSKSDLFLAKRQKGRCTECDELLIPTDGVPQTPQEWAGWFGAARNYLNRHHLLYRRDGGTDGGVQLTNLVLIHAVCHREHHARHGDRPQVTANL